MIKYYVILLVLMGVLIPSTSHATNPATIDAYTYRAVAGSIMCIVATLPSSSELEICKPLDAVGLLEPIQERKQFALRFIRAFQETFTMPYILSSRFKILTYTYSL